MAHFLPFSRMPIWEDLPRVPRNYLGPLSALVGLAAFVAVVLASPQPEAVALAQADVPAQSISK